jgi:hypothetical protein
VIIKLYWPECDFINNQWVGDRIDSYWVECTLEEAVENVFPYLLPEQIEASKNIWEPREKSKDIGIDTDRLCYLVSKDLRSIMPMPWFYPYSGMWNAYCPFVEIKNIEIKELSQIKYLTIINDIYDFIDKKLGVECIGKSPHFKHAKSCLQLSRPIELNAYDLIDGIYNCLTILSGPGAKNWELRKRTEYGPKANNETKIERCVAKQKGWYNQIPTCSGVMGSHSHHRMDIDLICCRDHNKAYDFVELKIASDTPLYAAIEILIYGVIYVFSRLHADKLGYTEKALPVLDATDVNLCVLAPSDFYYYGNQSYDLKWLADSLDSGIQRFVEEKKLSDSLKMGFQFEACLPEGFGPGDAKEIIKKYSAQQIPEWVRRRHFQTKIDGETC